MPTKSWGAGKRTCLHLPKPGARVQAVCWLRRRGHRGLGRGRWTQEAQAEGHTLHLPSPPLPHQGMQASGSPGEGPGRKLSKTTAPGGQMVSKTFLLNSAVKQKQYSCPLELGGGSDAADEVLCVQQLNTHTHIPTHTHPPERKTSGSSHSSGCLDALSPCHSLGSQPGGRSLEQAWGLEPETLLCYGTVHLIHQPSLTRLWAQAQGFSRAWPSQFFLSSSLRAQPPL